METRNKILIAGVLALIVGIGIGYCAGTSRKAPIIISGSHMMPNGQMMGNGSGMNSDTSMEDMMTSMNAGLAGKTGDDFDKAFLSEMIIHHEGAVGMAQAALQSAKHQEIKDLASAIISAQNKEIAEMQAWQKSWYNQ